MTSLKQTIVNAIFKVSTDPAYAGKEFATREEAREEFTRALLSELFPMEKQEVTVEMVTETLAEMKIDTAPVLPASPAKERKKRAPMSEEAKAAMKAKREAAKATEPKAEANLKKIDPTWRKHLKKAAGVAYTKEQEAALLTYLNAMDAAAFNAKKAEDHVAAFLEKKPEAPEETVATELVVVTFNEKTYYVNPETKRVYEGESDDEGALRNTKPVGYVGMGAFSAMEIDDE